ncbi:MAG: STAS domain-containing protein [Sumerlaeia bacterium]
MEVERMNRDECDILRLKGRLDLAGAEAIEGFFKEYRMEPMQGRRVIVNFAEVPYISSSGLRVLVSALNDVKEQGGEMVLCEMNVGVEEVFEFSGLNDVFKIYREEDDALQAVSAP